MVTGTEASFSKEEFKKKVVSNCKSLYRKNIDEADKQQVFQSVAYAVKDLIIDKWIATHKTYDKEDPKIVYYMSMEFLMGHLRSLDLILMLSRIRSQMQHLVMVDLEDLQHVSLIHLQLLNIQLMDVVSDISMVCSSRRLRTDIR